MRFRVEVQRIWKIQFGRVLWGFTKIEFKPQIAILKACLWGGIFPGPPAWGLEWELTVKA